MLDDIALFIHVVQQGGLSKAAQALSLPAATVTRRLQKLEQKLGSQLLHRSSRQLVLTQEGEVYYQAYAHLVEQFEQTRQQLSEDMKSLRGHLRVLAPSNISHGYLRPMWISFTRGYPAIRLELILGNQLQDIVAQQADFALRIGPQPDSQLYQQKLGQIDKVLVASPGYLSIHGRPSHPSDLRDHRLVGTNLSPRWQLQTPAAGTEFELYPKLSALSNDTGFIKYLALDGQGIALLPLTEVMAELATGDLVLVLPAWQGDVREIYAIWPSGRLLNERAKCLRDHIRHYLRIHPIGLPSNNAS